VVIYMPRLDGTGPNGAGPLTGRGMGNCGAFGRRCGFGRGMGLGRGLGFGRRWTATDEKTALEDEKKMLKEELAAVDEELNDLQDKK
jgi:hypothetical protein